jgi:uncharacterized metal-binding protein
VSIKKEGIDMSSPTSHFSLEVDGTSLLCPVGEKWAKNNITNKMTPVLSCEGPCIRGEIARLAADMISKEDSYARACYGEVIAVPHSSMAGWVKSADKIVMIDGCFLTCVGRIVKNLVDEKKIVHIDALRIHKKYSDLFLTEDVPEAERKETARQVADKILVILKDEKQVTKPAACAG